MGDGFVFLFPVMFITLACAFLIAWRWGAPIALWWGIGFLCSGVAATVPLLPHAIPGIVLGTIANGLFGLAFFCFGGALLRRAGAPMQTALRAGLLVVSVGAAVGAIAIGDLRAQIFAADLGCALLMAVGLPATARTLRQPVDYALFAIVALVSVETLLQAVTITFTLPAGDGKGHYLSTLYAFVMQSSAVVLGLIHALVALASVVLDRIAADRHAALRDPLTGLVTRQGLDQQLSAQPHAAEAAFVACDIDNLKQACEMFGPETADRVIVEIAGLVRAQCPAEGIAARVGDHRFLLHVPSGGRAAADLLADRLRSATRGHDWKDRGVVPTALAGLSLAAILSIDCHVPPVPG